MITRRSQPYPPLGAELYVPGEIWAHTLRAIRAYGRLRSEGLVLWGGVVANQSLQVTGLYLPHHKAEGWRAGLAPEEARWLVEALRARDEKLVVQVHSHPNEAFHSPGDDARAASFHTGYLSFVIPRFGRRVSALTECAGYEYDGAAFSELSREELQRRCHVLPLVEERH